MTRDDLVSLIDYTVPGLKAGDVDVLEDTNNARLLVAVRRPESDLVGLRAAVAEFPMGIRVDVRAVTDGGPLRLVAL